MENVEQLNEPFCRAALRVALAEQAASPSEFASKLAVVEFLNRVTGSAVDSAKFWEDVLQEIQLSFGPQAAEPHTANDMFNFSRQSVAGLNDKLGNCD